MNTCRLCREWKITKDTGPMFKYGVRHYAHARCAIGRWGREWLDKQPLHIISTFPFFLAQDLGVLDYLRARMEAGK